MKYRLAVFDFDGTLADSFPWFQRVFEELADEFELNRLTQEEYEAARGLDTPQLLKVLGVPLWKLPAVVTRIRKLALRDRGQIALFPEIPEMLARLKQRGVQTGIVSSNSEVVVRGILRADLAASIDHYACGASMFGKAAKLRKVLRRAGVEPADAIYIGDEIRDAIAAEAAGMDFGAVAWGYAAFEALLKQKPARSFQTPSEIFTNSRL